METLTTLVKGTPPEKLKLLLDVYDADGSGSFDREELVCVLRSGLEESCLQLEDDQLQSLALALFSSAGRDLSGEISSEELRMELLKQDSIVDNLTKTTTHLLTNQEDEEAKKKKQLIPRYLTPKYIKNNVRKVVFLLIYSLISLVLAVIAGVNHKDDNGFVILARICGMCLNFNCTLTVVFVLRKCLTWLRDTKAANFLPLDQSILFHKMVGIMILVLSLLHTAGHLGNVVILSSEKDRFTVWEYLFTTRPGIGWVAGTACLTGDLLDIILVVMITCSMPFIRRSGHFQVFYWSHFLYIPFWFLLILHAPNFWKWFIVPGLVFIAEKISQSKLFKLARYGQTCVKEVNLLPSKVTHLVISRPPNFQYEPGDYVFLQIPAIAAHEWHPFTLSSDPYRRDFLWTHIRSVGHWTNKLYDYFDTCEEEDDVIADVTGQNNSNGGIKTAPDVTAFTTSKIQGDVIVDMDMHKNKSVEFKSYKMTSTDYVHDEDVQLFERRACAELPKEPTYQREKNKQTNIEVFIDGPYGTSTREIFETEHAVLICSGIGVTPYASILQNMMSKYKTSKQTCPQCEHSWYEDPPEGVMKCRKVDFIWINRDQKSFEWFVSLLSQLEREQARFGLGDFLTLHFYMTTAEMRSDLKGLILRTAIELLHSQEKRDFITGLQTRTQTGRPNWDQVFHSIADQRKGKVKVFFCGAPQIAKVVKDKCQKFHFGFSKENFS